MIQMFRTTSCALILLLVGVINYCTSTDASASMRPNSTRTRWICRPGLVRNPCLDNRTTIISNANSLPNIVRPPARGQPDIDCFYLYPVVSDERGDNAAPTIGPAQVNEVYSEMGQFSQLCKVYAPVYRQVTLEGLGAGISRKVALVAYDSALRAWNDYLDHYNDGRGFVLIGDGEGASILTALIRSRIDTDRTLRHRMVSAILVGANVKTASGKTTGGDFQHIVLCRRAAQTGCVMTYSAFEEVPPSNSMLGRVGQGVGDRLLAAIEGTQPKQTVALEVGCTNPASLSGGTGVLQPILATGPIEGKNSKIKSTEPWIEFPYHYGARCSNSDGAMWLKVNPHLTPGDPRLSLPETLGPTWGLSLEEIGIAYGNLLNAVEAQGRNYIQRH